MQCRRARAALRALSAIVVNAGSFTELSRFDHSTITLI
jgi:hypothetical protein